MSAKTVKHVEKRRVVMTSTSDSHKVVATDYVPLDILDAYVADAKTRWDSVEVPSDQHDPGPGGDQGETHRPAHLIGA